MSKGIIYIMTSVLLGLIKIGKTGSDQFEKRMDFLEKNGYRNITGLKRKFAINGVLQEDYDLGNCTPSFAGCVVMNASSNGWMDWKNKEGKPVDIYRPKKNTAESDE